MYEEEEAQRQRPEAEVVVVGGVVDAVVIEGRQGAKDPKQMRGMDIRINALGMQQ